MEQKATNPTTERDDAAPAPRSQPIPLADRRRLMRPSQIAEGETPVFNDWASI